MKKNLKFPINKKPNNPLKLDKFRHYQVRTRNLLIQNTSFSLSAKQQKIILHLIQKISNKTTNLKFRFNVKDYERFLGIRTDSRNTKDIKRALQQLADKSFWIRTRHVDSDHPDDEYDDLIRWFSKVRYNRTRGYFEVEFDKRLKPFLLNIKTNFTSFDYHNIIGMQKSYSIRLYQIFISHYNEQNREYGYKYSISQLRFQLGIPHNKYKRFADLNRRVIEPSLREMNDKTNFNFYCNRIKHGRKTIGLRILLRKKNNTDRRLAMDNVDRKLLGKPVKPKKVNKSKQRTKTKEIQNTESKAERAFKKDLKQAHLRGAKKSELKDHREFLRKREAKKRHHKKKAAHQKKLDQYYKNKYKN